jgi:rare lipoprotein A
MKKLPLLIVLFIFTFQVSSFAQQKHQAKATFYSQKFNGRRTASGEKYWDYLPTAASNFFKLGTRLLVTNKRNGKSIEVVVNDRMASRYNKHRLDLSKSAYKNIASINTGVVPVEIEIIENDDDLSYKM